MLALGAALDVLAAANECLGERIHEAVTLTLEGGTVRPANGPVLAVDGAVVHALDLQSVWVLSDLPLPDSPRDGHATALQPWLRERAAEGATLGGIGTGAAVLAQAGLLDGHRATLPWSHVPQMARSHPSVVWSSNVYEIDRRRLSCAGSTATLDLLITWLGSLHGERLVKSLVAQFGLERLRAADERQSTPLAGRIGAGNAKLSDAVALMEANLGEPLPTEDIARLVGVSRRQLERLFKQHLDALPSRYYAELRLARARRLLQQTSQSILQIGLASGFASGSHFSNAYRARFGHTPRDERSQRANAWRDHTDPIPMQEPPP